MYQPSLFLSHGAPDIALKTGHPTYRFFQELPRTFPRPDAIVSFSAHWCADKTLIAKDASYHAIHDFGGFDERLYSMRYSPKGNPELAQMVFDLVKQHDRKAKLVNNPELDHGIWIPLMIMYPDPVIPVIQVAIQPDQSPEYHYGLGESLAELRSHNVLIIGSGSMTHNLFAMTIDDHEAAPPAWVRDFCQWMNEHLEEGDTEAILQYRQRAPHATRNHPTDEHLLPLFIAMGAGAEHPGTRIYSASSYGTIAMDAYRFD